MMGCHKLIEMFYNGKEHSIASQKENVAKSNHEPHWCLRGRGRMLFYGQDELVSNQVELIR